MTDKKRFFILAAFLMLFLSGCGVGEEKAKSSRPDTEEKGYKLKDEVSNINEHLDYSDSKLKKIYFAGGCFWGVEAYMSRLYGVKDTISGYANGTGKNPSYEDAISGDEHFAETVEVVYDPERISLEKLIDRLFQVIDPTTEDQQGNDVGVQYRTGIYYGDEADADVVKKSVKKEQKYYEGKIVTEATSLENFYKAEDFHQDYLEKNPNGYCHINLESVNDYAINPIEKDEEIVKKLSK